MSIGISSASVLIASTVASCLIGEVSRTMVTTFVDSVGMTVKPPSESLPTESVLYSAFRSANCLNVSCG